jgi:hypothetical protein
LRIFCPTQYCRRKAAHPATSGKSPKLAKEHNCGRLEWAVLDWDEPAIGFYKRIGAAPVSGWMVYRVTGEALEELAGR